jgi:hypothetical protein
MWLIHVWLWNVIHVQNCEHNLKTKRDISTLVRTVQVRSSYWARTKNQIFNFLKFIADGYQSVRGHSKKRGQSGRNDHSTEFTLKQKLSSNSYRPSDLSSHYPKFDFGKGRFWTSLEYIRRIQQCSLQSSKHRPLQLYCGNGRVMLHVWDKYVSFRFVCFVCMYHSAFNRDPFHTNRYFYSPVADVRNKRVAVEK